MMDLHCGLQGNLNHHLSKFDGIKSVSRLEGIAGLVTDTMLTSKEILNSSIMLSTFTVMCVRLMSRVILFLPFVLIAYYVA